jgi:hypothetical protein
MEKKGKLGVKLHLHRCHFQMKTLMVSKTFRVLPATRFIGLGFSRFWELTNSFAGGAGKAEAGVVMAGRVWRADGNPRYVGMEIPVMWGRPGTVLCNKFYGWWHAEVYFRRKIKTK